MAYDKINIKISERVSNDAAHFSGGLLAQRALSAASHQNGLREAGRVRVGFLQTQQWVAFGAWAVVAASVRVRVSPRSEMPLWVQLLVARAATAVALRPPLLLLLLLRPAAVSSAASIAQLSAVVTQIFVHERAFGVGTRRRLRRA